MDTVLWQSKTSLRNAAERCAALPIDFHFADHSCFRLVFNQTLDVPLFQFKMAFLSVKQMMKSQSIGELQCNRVMQFAFARIIYPVAYAT